MEEWLIDGYNLLFAGEIGHDDSAREYLFSRLRLRFGEKKVRVTVVFDSRWSASHQREKIADNLTAVYAAGSADEYIVRAARQSRYPRSTTVVTNDREIIAATRQYRCRAMSCEHFLALLTTASPPPPKSEKPLADSPEQIQRLLELWGEID